MTMKRQVRVALDDGGTRWELGDLEPITYQSTIDAMWELDHEDKLWVAFVLDSGEVGVIKARAYIYANEEDEADAA